MITNAATEFSKFVHGKDVLCVDIAFADTKTQKVVSFQLPVGYSYEQYVSFVSSLHFHYDSGFGMMYLDGYIWFKDGTWGSRFEYDGSECWVHNVCPEIPEELE